MSAVGDECSKVERWMWVDTPRSFVLEVRHFMACKIICDYIFKFVDFGISSTVDGDTFFCSINPELYLCCFLITILRCFRSGRFFSKSVGFCRFGRESV